MDIEELGQVERCSLPGSGSCGKASPQLFVGCHSNCNVTYHVDVVFTRWDVHSEHYVLSCGGSRHGSTR